MQATMNDAHCRANTHVYSRKPAFLYLKRSRKFNVKCSAQQHPRVSRRSALAIGIGLSTYLPALVQNANAGIDTSSSSGSSSAQSDFKLGFEERISEFTLPNGLHFIILERHVAPIVSCHVYANVGAFDEEEGSTGLAHLLEHMAFKGTSRIGSKDFQREAPLLDALDEVFYSLRDAQARGSQAEVLRLSQQLQQLQETADQLTVPNAFGSLLQKQGAVGLNATTSHDQTRYFTSLPANKLELWFALEAERFQDPVFRELYSEKRVIEEERRLRVDNSPLGRYQQQYSLRALGNNYRRPVIGFAEDVAAMGRREVQAFFDRHYGPANLTISVVGDVTPDQVYQLATKYFGSWDPLGYERHPCPTFSTTSTPSVEALQEPLPLPSAFQQQQPDGQSYRDFAKSGPAVMLGFYRPPLTTYDGIVLQALSDIISGGRTSRLVSELVLKEKLLSASVIVGYPGERHAGLSIVYGIPRQGSSVEAAEKLICTEMDRLLQEGVTEQELYRVKKSARSALLSTIQSNSAMASALASYHALVGSWRGLAQELELVQGLGREDMLRVARSVFAADNCFKGYILKA